MTLPSEKLAELGLELPEVAKPVAAYVPAIEDRGVVRTSGQLPLENGELACIGAVGEEGADPEDAYEAARICALNAMAAAAAVAGGVDRLASVVKVTAFVASLPNFLALSTRVRLWVLQPCRSMPRSRLRWSLHSAASEWDRSALYLTRI